MRGSLDNVYVNYSVTQTNSADGETPAHEDFLNATGAVLFVTGQRSEVCDNDSPVVNAFEWGKNNSCGCIVTVASMRICT